jgi:hypothetical protein
MIRISASVTGVEDIRPEVDRKEASGFSGLLDAVRAKARELAPKKTGSLRDSIEAYLAGELQGVLESGAHYSSYLIGGTGIYGPRGREISISPVNRDALFWPGAKHPVKRVVIKGIKPGDFLTRAIEEADLQDAFDKGFGEG